MKAVMLSVRPQYCEKIASRGKTLDVRKTRPRIGTPFKCYIYCTLKPDDANNLLEIHIEDEKIYRANGKIIGEFVCDYIPAMQNVITGEWFLDTLTAACLTPSELDAYSGGKMLYGWHISALQIYNKPRELSEFCAIIHNGTWEYPKKITHPPQSWCYVEEREAADAER